MANGTFEQDSFATGKISKNVYGRKDLARRYSGLAECENFVSTQQGPLVRRPGTRFVAQAKDATTIKRMIPFQYSTDQTYQLEFGHRYIRFYKNREQIMDDGSLKSAGTSSTPFEIETPYNEYSSGTANVINGTSSTSPANIGITGFAWGDTASGGLIPDGIARFTLASSAATGGIISNMRVEVDTVTMSDGIEARKVNKTHTVITGDQDSAFNIDVAMPSDPGASVSTAGAEVDIPSNATIVADPGDFATGDLFHGMLVDFSNATEVGVASRPGYNTRANVIRAVDGSANFRYLITPVGGTCDNIDIDIVNRSVDQIDYAQNADVLFLSHPNVPRKELQRVQGYKVSDASHTTWQSGTVTLTIASNSSPHPFQANSDVDGVYSKVIISGCVPTGYNGCFDVVAVTPSTISYVTGAGDPGLLTTFGTVEGWQVVDSPDHDGPYEKEFSVVSTDSDAAAIDPVLTVTIASGAAGLSSGDDLLTVTVSEPLGNQDIGRMISSKDGATDTWANGKLSFFESHASTPAAAFYVDRNEALPFGNGAQAAWKLGKWSNVNGWPWTVSFLNGRLASGGSNAYPSSFWASVPSDINNHRPFTSESPYTLTAGDAIDLPLDDEKVNSIYWMQNTPNGMIVGTDNSEILLKQTSTTAPLGPTNIEYRAQSSIGSKRFVKPVRVGNSGVMFVNKTGRKIYDISFNPDTIDSFFSTDLNLLSDSLTESGIGGIAYAQDPYPIVWSYLDNGKLIGLTYDKSQEVIGWHEHVVSGTAVSGQDRARVISVSTIHDTSGAEPVSQVWMIVERNVNSTTEHHIEFMEDYYKTSDSLEDAVFMDGSVEYDGVSATAMTGLDHHEGETVKVFADGVLQADQTVVSGAITIDTAATKVQMGLAMTSKMATLPIEYQNIRPEGVHKVKRAERLILDVMDAQGLEYGMSETDLYTVPLDDTTTLHTGIIGDMNLGACYGRDQRIWVVNSSVFPTTIRSLSAEVEYQPIED